MMEKKKFSFINLLRILSWIVLIIPWVVFLQKYLFFLEPGGVNEWMLSGSYFDWGGFFITLDISILSFGLLYSMFLILKKLYNEWS